MIIDTKQFIETEKIQNIPNLINLFDKESLTKILLAAGFSVDKISYISRTDFPPDRLFDGRESVGAIASKSTG